MVFELLLGFVFCIWAALTVPGKFLSIHPDSEENRYYCLSSFFVPFFFLEFWLRLEILFLAIEAFIGHCSNETKICDIRVLE